MNRFPFSGTDIALRMIQYFQPNWDILATCSLEANICPSATLKCQGATKTALNFSQRENPCMVMKLKVRELVEARALTWQRFAEETGLSKQTVYALMSGKVTRIDLNTLDVLCAYFEVAVSDILEYEK